jgi:hypothetical protein
VVQANSTLIEGKSVSRIEKLVKSDEGLTSDEPDSASKWTGLFVQDQLSVEESLVPQDTAEAIVNIQPFAELLAGLSGSEADAVPMAG